MPRRLSITVALLALVTHAEAADRAAVEQHLIRLSTSAKMLGATRPDASVQVMVGLRCGLIDRAPERRGRSAVRCPVSTATTSGQVRPPHPQSSSVSTVSSLLAP